MFSPRESRRSSVTVASVRNVPESSIHVQTDSVPETIVASANTPMTKPKNPLPTSPMNILAGGQFSGTKPTHAAASTSIATTRGAGWSPIQHGQGAAGSAHEDSFRYGDAIDPVHEVEKIQEPHQAD